MATIIQTFPVQQSLWNDCLYECIVQAKKDGKTIIDIDDVDAVVLQKSKYMRQGSFSRERFDVDIAKAAPTLKKVAMESVADETAKNETTKAIS